METTGLNMEVNTGTIRSMPDIEDYLTTREAKRLADGMGVKMSLSYISRMARDGRIDGSVRVGDWETAPWLLPRTSFVEYLENRAGRGRPKES